MKKKSLSFGVLINIIGTFLLKGVSLFLLPVVTRLLSKADYGMTTIFNTWTAVLAIIVSLQAYSSLTNARVEMDDKAYKKYVSNTVFISLLGNFAFGVFIYLLRVPLSQALQIDKALVLLFIPRAMGTTFVSFFSTYLIIENKAGKNLIVSLSISLSSIGLSLLMAFFVDAFQGRLYYAFILGNTIPAFLVGIGFIFWSLWRGRDLINRTYWRYCLSISLPLVFHSLAGLILAQSDHVMLQQLYSLESAGAYGFTYNIASVVSTIWSATNAVWVPFFFKNLQENNPEEALLHARRFSQLFIIICFGFMMVYPETVRILATPEYCQNFEIVPLVTIAYMFMHIYSFPANYEFYKKQTRWTALGSLMAAVVNVILNYILIPRYGQMGAAVATAISYAMLFVFHETIARYVVRGYAIPRSFAWKQIIIACLITASFYVLQDIWVVRWALAASAGIYALVSIYKRKAII